MLQYKSYIYYVNLQWCLIDLGECVINILIPKHILHNLGIYIYIYSFALAFWCDIDWTSVDIWQAVLQLIVLTLTGKNSNTVQDTQTEYTLKTKNDLFNFVQAMHSFLAKKYVDNLSNNLVIIDTYWKIMNQILILKHLLQFNGYVYCISSAMMPERSW